MRFFHTCVMIAFLFSCASLCSADYITVWQIGNVIFQRKQAVPFEEEPVARSTARYFANVLFLPSSVIIAPFYYGANIMRIEDTSYMDAAEMGFWASYTIIGFPFAVLEYSLVRLPVKTFDRLF